MESVRSYGKHEKRNSNHCDNDNLDDVSVINYPVYYCYCKYFRKGKHCSFAAAINSSHAVHEVSAKKENDISNIQDCHNSRDLIFRSIKLNHLSII